MQVSLPAHVAIPSHVLMQDYDDEAVLLNLQNKHYYTLNEAGLRCWQSLAEDGSVARMRERLSAQYAVDAPRLEADVAALLERLLEAGLVEARE